MRLLALMIALGIVVAACADTGDPSPEAEVSGAASTGPVEVPALPGETAVATTLHRLDGNRYVAGRGAMPSASPVDVQLDVVPAWVVGVVENREAVWLVAGPDGSIYRIDTEGVRAVDVALAPGQPPAAAAAEDGASTILTGGSPLTHPLPLQDGRLALVDGGTVRVMDSDDGDVVTKAAPLPDARLITDGTGSVIFLSGPTDGYPHGVVGDVLEAEAVTTLEAGGSESTFALPDGLVVEGIAPIWSDVDGDGDREIIVTLSDAAAGARIAVFDEDGSELARGPAIGIGGRWRHQIAVAPFGPGGEMELAAVLTPHIGGVVEFYRRNGDVLEIVAAVPGFTSHVLGSRNLDLALAADADGDGRVEIVAPTKDRTRFGGIQRTVDGAEAVWLTDLGGTLSTNLAAVTLPDGAIWFAAGRRDGILRIWPGS